MNQNPDFSNCLSIHDQLHTNMLRSLGQVGTQRLPLRLESLNRFVLTLLWKFVRFFNRTGDIPVMHERDNSKAVTNTRRPIRSVI